MGLLSTLKFIHRHPLNRGGRLRALGRFVQWQLASRIAPGPIALPYVDETRLLVVRGMTGATGNWYCGLHEQDDMGFVLHFLRQDDLFIDIGANVGSYTVLAAGAVGCRTVSIEPIPSTFSSLWQNVRLNELNERTTLMNVGLGAAPGELKFTRDLGAMNRALGPSEVHEHVVTVPITTLDSIAAFQPPKLCKIDVEGFETQVLAGGVAVLSSQALRCVLMEINGSGRNFGIADAEIHATVCRHGFVPGVSFEKLVQG